MMNGKKWITVSLFFLIQLHTLYVCISIAKQLCDRSEMVGENTNFLTA